MKKYLLILSGIIFMLPAEVLAHGGHGTGFIAGLTHPIFGLDHMVAIICSGLLGYHLLSEKPWAPALAFITAMIIGGLLGIQASPLGLTELVIVFSVIIAGAFIAFDVQVNFILYILLFALFGFFHGHAHGTEMPEDSNVPLYVIGFVLGAGVLSTIGWGLNKVIKKEEHIHLLGACMVGMGIMMLLG